MFVEEGNNYGAAPMVKSLVVPLGLNPDCSQCLQARTTLNLGFSCLGQLKPICHLRAVGTSTSILMTAIWYPISQLIEITLTLQRGNPKKNHTISFYPIN